MSLIGIDLGSSSIKVAAYAVDGTALAAARRNVPGYRPEPGHWEVDVRELRRPSGRPSPPSLRTRRSAPTRRWRSRSAPPGARSSQSPPTAHRWDRA